MIISTKVNKISKLIFLFLFLSLFSVLTKPTYAQNKIPPGITVIPSIQNIDLATDPPEYQLSYINGTKTPIDLSLSAQDFTELEDGYKLSFLEGKEASNYKYSLSSWISFENKNLHLDPGETKSIMVFIDSKRITRGGHYASILAEVKQPKNKKQIDIRTIISSLLFVRSATGLEVESGVVSTLKPVRDWLDFPDSFNLRFQNNGNVQIIPYGIVEVYDPLGRKVATGIINEGSLNTIPESIRRYSVETKPNSKFLIPGIYKTNIAIHFGKTNQKASKSVRFISSGSINPLIILIILAGIGLFIFYIGKRRKHKTEN